MVTTMSRGTGASGRLRPNPKAAIPSMLLFAALSGNASCQAQEKANILPETQAGRQIMVELQELGPVESDRKIRTANFDFLFHIRRFDSPDFKFYGGLTVSRSRGAITRRTDSAGAGTLMDENLDSTATGAGPVLAIRAEFPHSGNVSASLDGSAGILLYDRDFPAGASRYDFMFRYGPTLSYRLNGRQALSLTLRGMHVSNGQGINRHNPQYNAAGLGVQFLGAF